MFFRIGAIRRNAIFRTTIGVAGVAALVAALGAAALGPTAGDAANSPLKKGTGSEPTRENPAKTPGRETPVPLFQRAAKGTVIVARDGKSTAVIVLARRPTRPAQLAAKEFAHYVRKITGAELPAVSDDEVKMTREHNDANVLTVGSRYMDEPRVMELVRIFLDTEFAGGRHALRVAKIAQIERSNTEDFR